MTTVAVIFILLVGTGVVFAIDPVKRLRELNATAARAQRRSRAK